MSALLKLIKKIQIERKQTLISGSFIKVKNKTCGTVPVLLYLLITIDRTVFYVPFKKYVDRYMFFSFSMHAEMARTGMDCAGLFFFCPVHVY